MPTKALLYAAEVRHLARHGATLCIFLSARLSESVQEQLLGAYPPETPTAILYRVSWPDEQIVVTELRHLSAEMKKLQFTRTTLILVGAAVGGRRNRSRLYDKSHAHLFRPRTRREDGLRWAWIDSPDAGDVAHRRFRT